MEWDRILAAGSSVTLPSFSNYWHALISIMPQRAVVKKSPLAREPAHFLINYLAWVGRDTLIGGEGISDVREKIGARNC